MIKKNWGFTLIELMVTIVIFAVIASVAAPSFNTFVAKQNLTSSARDLVLVFGDARAKAAVLRSTTSVVFDHGSNTERVFYWAPDSDDIQLVGDKMDVVFNENGFAQLRSKSVPKKNDEGEEIPDEFEDVNVPTVFVLCSLKLKEGKKVTISKTGIVEAIKDSGDCNGNS
ncbi:prepilin-type N-terminal cleavage/methylation domain-containing protein [Acinetobacter sp. 194]|uniref:pilus assembly FimT family protein n=1 Tax=Acinetobacter shaoyimingii TaxID=2715164 RepID=UPI001409AF3F|nr:prepilin-type N-terminal cleavage/methylation domain-containing protein [Acinetobacter shaoyimingii]NHB58077.1 prepilin-type N-terminal cleavage/methylation domain-containing protein [Acinetobacter shaoyimingii]